ncbi:MAG: sulfatase-like hydrolase/transferase [Rubripirellula sp.]
MKSIRVLLCVLTITCVIDPSEPCHGQQEKGERANVILIIADDLGYGETGVMGNDEIPTPHIDALAKDGTRCTSAYVTASYCSPSRAGIFTGRYQSRFGYEMNPTGKRNLHKEAGLPESEKTFVSRLSDAGYKTGLVGKWHLGTVDSKKPTSRGFDHFYGFLHEGHYYVPGPPYKDVLTMIRDNSLEAGERVREKNLIRGNYARISEPKYDADNPILRGDKEIEEARYLTDAITEEAVEFIEENAGDPMCLVVSYGAVHSPMQATTEDVRSLRRIKDIQRRIFAGMLTSLDRGVGQIREAIEAQSLRRKTMVVFISDNGGPTAELTSSNAPLRGGKGSLYEGGIRVPMIWSFPGKIPAERVESRPMLSLDIAATALDVAGLEADQQADGKSLLSWINDPTLEYPHEALYWRMSGGKLALRMGNWKIVRAKKGESIELFHLAGDISEERNLASEQGEKMKELVNRWYAMNAEMAEPIVLPK